MKDDGKERGRGSHCCAGMHDRLADGETAVLYIPKFREYGIRVLDGGSSFISISHCPWCGMLLPSGLRDRYFDLLEAQGIRTGLLDLEDDPRIPAEMHTEEWWRRRWL